MRALYTGSTSIPIKNRCQLNFLKTETLQRKQLMKPLPVEQTNPLTDQACMAYHDAFSLAGFWGYWCGGHNLALSGGFFSTANRFAD